MANEFSNRGRFVKYYDEDGCYITHSQLRFFLNRSSGRRSFKAQDAEFIDYYHECRTYNLISDMMEGDPGCAFLVWDNELQDFVFFIPRNGSVTRKITKLGIEEKG